MEDLTNTSLGTPNQFQWKFNTTPQAPTNIANSFSALESDAYKPLSGSRSKEPYHSKGSMERERGKCPSFLFFSLSYLSLTDNIFLIFFQITDGPGSRSGSHHGSRDNSAARNTYSSRSLQQMRPPQMQYNTLPLNSSSSSQNRMRSDKVCQ